MFLKSHKEDNENRQNNTANMQKSLTFTINKYLKFKKNNNIKSKGLRVSGLIKGETLIIISINISKKIINEDKSNFFKLRLISVIETSKTTFFI